MATLCTCEFFVSRLLINDLQKQKSLEISSELFIKCSENDDTLEGKRIFQGVLG